MKRLFLIVILVLIASLLVVSCSSGKTTPVATQTQPQATSTTAPATTSKAPATSSAAAPSSSATQAPASTSAAKTPKYGGVLKIVSATISGALGWPPDYAGPITGPMQHVFQTLLRQKVDGTIYPFLASSYEVAPDKQSVTFQIRKGIKFHDGSELTAEVVKFNYDAQIAANKAPYWKSVEVIDNYTVKVNLKSWTNIVLSSFGESGAGMLASMEAFQKNGLDWVKAHPIGTGPFIFKSYVQDAKMVFTRNDNYWEKGKPYLDGIEIIFTSDSLTSRNMLINGDVYVRSGEINKKDVNDLREKGFNIKVQYQATYSLIPDSANADSPYSNPLVRQAVEYAIDKDAIAAGFGGGNWKAPYQLPPRDNSAYNPNFSIVRKYDPAKAKQLLKEAGYPSGFKTTLVPGLAKNLDAAQAIQANLNAVGIITEIKDMDTAAYMQYRSGGSWKNALLIEPIATWANYNQTLNYYFGATSQQFKSWARPPKFLEALDATLASLEPDVNLIRKASDILSEEAAVIPVHEGGATVGVWDFVKDAGHLTRSFPIYWNSENTWLDK